MKCSKYVIDKLHKNWMTKLHFQAAVHRYCWFTHLRCSSRQTWKVDRLIWLDEIEYEWTISSSTSSYEIDRMRLNIDASKRKAYEKSFFFLKHGYCIEDFIDNLFRTQFRIRCSILWGKWALKFEKRIQFCGNFFRIITDFSSVYGSVSRLPM